jgi:hypothetical protein
MEAVDLRGALVREIAALSAQFAQEVAGLREQFTEDIAKAVQEQAKSGNGATDVTKSNFSAPRSSLRTQFTFTSSPRERGEMPSGGIISHLMAKCGFNVHEEPRDVAVFFGSIAKDPDTTKQKSYGYLTGTGSQSRNVNFARCSGIFRLRGGSSTLKDSLKAAIPGKFVVTPDGVHQIAVDFAEDCQGSVEIFFGIKC